MNKNIFSKFEIGKNLSARNVAATIFCSLILGSFIWWMVCIFVEGTGSPQYSLFFHGLDDFLADTLNNIKYTMNQNFYFDETNGAWEHAYPPLPEVFFYLLSRITFEGGQPLFYYVQAPLLIILIIILVFSILFLFHLLYRNLAGFPSNLGFLVALSLCVSYPVLYTIERGNSLLASVFFASAFVFYYRSDNRVMRELSLISLAISSAIKLYPAVLGILLLYDKRWREAIQCAIYGIVFTVLPFFVFKGGILNNISKMINNIQANLAIYENPDGCGLIAAVYHFGRIFIGENFFLDDFEQNLLRGVTIILGMVLLFGGLISKEQWQRVLCVIIALVILPSHSGSYNAMYFIPATILFLAQFEDRLYNWLILLTMVPLYWVHRNPISDIYNYNFSIPVLAFMAIINVISSITKENKLI